VSNPADDRDQRLLADLRRGEAAAFDAMFREYYAALVQSANTIVRDPGTAEEIVQEVMFRVWQGRQTLPVEESLRGYLYRATRNRALNHVRHERLRARKAPLLADPEEAAPSAPGQLAEAELEAALRSALDALPPRCREVFELSRLHHLRYAEIASTLGISVKTVEAQMGKALRLLRERLAPYLPAASDPR
jgi:RNA polymerase sigma-70 factor, ECF subfamily